MNIRCLLGRHQRSAKGRFRDTDGLLKSTCSRCGVRMVRAHGSRSWVAYANRDFRARTAPLRVLLDRLTGPVIFLLVMGGLLGAALWIGGPPRPLSNRVEAGR